MASAIPVDAYVPDVVLQHRSRFLDLPFVQPAGQIA
jgi:hypothetical protein